MLYVCKKSQPILYFLLEVHHLIHTRDPKKEGPPIKGLNKDLKIIPLFQLRLIRIGVFSIGSTPLSELRRFCKMDLRFFFFLIRSLPSWRILTMPSTYEFPLMTAVAFTDFTLTINTQSSCTNVNSLCKIQGNTIYATVLV